MIILKIDLKNNMKTTLTIEQSNTLIRMGVPNNKASDFEAVSSTNPRGIGGQVMMARPIFTLTDLLSLLPKSIEHGGYAEAKLNIYTRPHRRECWVAKYIVSAKTIPYDGAGEELIDALYEMLCKLIDNHVKLD